MLIAALLFGPLIFENRVGIDNFLGRDLQNSSRYLDGSVKNIWLHLTFLFGMVPSYAYRTPLPDWSLGLEMQFYTVFPLLILLTRKMGWFGTVILAAGGSVIVVGMMGKVGIDFPMPAFLPLKMHLFLCGMLIANAVGADGVRLWSTLILALFLAAIPVGGAQDVGHFVIREMIVLSFFALVHLRRISVVDWTSKLLGVRPFHWLGELSYGVYLCHLLLLQPVAAWVILGWGHSISNSGRFMLVLVIVAPLAYAIAYLTYMSIELPGQKLGKIILRKLAGSRGKADQVPAERIAAP